MCGSSRGYVSRTWARMPRATEDLTLLFEPATKESFLNMVVVVDVVGCNWDQCPQDKCNES